MAHSRSPVIHNHWLAHHGIAGRYVLFPVPPEKLEAAGVIVTGDLERFKREAEALPLLEKLVEEFEKSEHLLPAQKMITELKAQVVAKPGT